MKRSSLTPKKTNHQKLSTLDSVSASELLKALHTLESINMIQEQIDDDLNISFSQKDTFSQDGNGGKGLVNMGKTMINVVNAQNHYQQQQSNRPSTTKNRTPQNSAKQANKQLSAIKNKTSHQPTHNDSTTSKMNFQFYMGKKQHSLMRFNKNQSRSPRPSQQQQSKTVNNKSFENTLGSTGKKAKENMTPRGKMGASYARNGVIVERERMNDSSVSPLTERVINGNRADESGGRNNKEGRLKTEANDRDVNNNSFKKRHTKANSSFVQPNNDNQFTKTHSTPYKQPQPTKPTQHPTTTTTQKKPRPSSTLQNLSMLQRNKEYLRQKNQRLAKLCQYVEQKKRQEQKQCTFKPKLLNDNSNIKAKYNDLCVSRELVEKGHKKCKQGKENANEQECVGEEEQGSRARCEGRVVKGGKSSLSNNSKKSKGNEVNEESLSLQDEKPTVSTVKTKYKNSKFNILLDLIH